MYSNHVTLSDQPLGLLVSIKDGFMCQIITPKTLFPYLLNCKDNTVESKYSVYFHLQSNTEHDIFYNWNIGISTWKTFTLLMHSA